MKDEMNDKNLMAIKMLISHFKECQMKMGFENQLRGALNNNKITHL